MTTKKIVTIVLSILLALGLLVAIFAGAIVLFVFHQVGKSDAAMVARSFLKSNERLKQDIGEVRDFGWFITGHISIQNGSGTATLNLSVIGAKKTVNATVDLIYRNGKDWRVTSAAYRNEEGKTIELFNPYESILRWQMSDVRCQNDCRSQTPYFKPQAPGFRPQITNHQSEINNHRSQFSKSKTVEHCLESVILV
jgi:hypothetical protein